MGGGENFTFITKKHGVFTFDPCPSEFDTKLEIFASDGTLVGENDDYLDKEISCFRQSKIDQLVLLAGSYTVKLGSSSGAYESKGPYSLSLSCFYTTTITTSRTTTTNTTTTSSTATSTANTTNTTSPSTTATSTTNTTITLTTTVAN